MGFKEELDRRTPSGRTLAYAVVIWYFQVLLNHLHIISIRGYCVDVRCEGCTGISQPLCINM
jgi:hypothetical protein